MSKTKRGREAGREGEREKSKEKVKIAYYPTIFEKLPLKVLICRYFLNKSIIGTSTC